MAAPFLLGRLKKFLFAFGFVDADIFLCYNKAHEN